MIRVDQAEYERRMAAMKEQQERTKRLPLDATGHISPETVQQLQEALARKSKPSKALNPKDAVGVAKWRQFFSVPQRVLWEIGVGLMEGALKYGRFNYRATGVQASIYVDAAKGHISAWEEGEDIDPDTGLSHITKAICSLIVLRDGMLQGNFVDDRAPRHASMEAHKAELQQLVDKLFAKYPNPVAPFTEQPLPKD